MLFLSPFKGLAHFLVDSERTRKVRAPAAEERFLENVKFWNYEIDPDAVLDALRKALVHVHKHKSVNLESSPAPLAQHQEL